MNATMTMNATMSDDDLTKSCKNRVEEQINEGAEYITSQQTKQTDNHKKAMR
jgi:hypothetical protein